MKNFSRICCVTLMSLIFQCHAIVAQVSFGVKAGMNVNDTKLKSDISFPDISDHTTSFHAGVFANVKAANNLFFIPELEYMQKGYSITSYGNSPTGGLMKITTKHRINYIEMPLLFSYRVIKYVNVDAGVVTGFLFSAAAVRNGKKIDNTNGYSSKVDFGLTAGIRLNLPEGFGLASRYAWSLNALNEPNSENTREYSRNFLVSLTYVLIKRDAKNKDGN